MSNFSLVDPEQFEAGAVSPAAGTAPLVIEAHFSSSDHPLDDGFYGWSWTGENPVASKAGNREVPATSP